MDSVLKYILIAAGVLAILIASWEAPKESPSVPQRIWAQHRTTLHRINAVMTVGVTIFGIGLIGVGIGYPAQGPLPPLTEVEQTTCRVVGTVCIAVGVVCGIVGAKLSEWYLRRVQLDDDSE